MDFTTFTDADLTQLIADAQSALASRNTAPTPIRYTARFGSYNARRYSRPWIARVTSWPVGGKPDIEWGAYLGDNSGGEVEIMALPGDIIRYGQKDGRGNHGASEWAIAQPDGTLLNVDQADARKAFGGDR